MSEEKYEDAMYALISAVEICNSTFEELDDTEQIIFSQKIHERLKHLPKELTFPF